MATETEPRHRASPTVPPGRPRAMVVAAVRPACAGEPGLSAVGAAGVVLALVCLVGVAVRGRFIPPEGKLLDAATFCFGVGLFTITVALLLPLVPYAPTARRRWRRAFYVFPVYGLVLESLQAFRGFDPRFSDEGSQLDVIAGVIFGLTALSNTILFVLLGAALHPRRHRGQSARVAPRDPVRRRRGRTLVRRRHRDEFFFFF